MNTCENLLELVNPDGQIEDEEFATGYVSNFVKTVKFISSLGATIDIAEEIAQAAWARGWQRRHQLLQKQFLGSWVNTIARNLFHEHFAKSRRFSELVEFGVHSNIESTMEAGSVLAGCTPSETAMLKMYYFEGYSSQEIAESQNINPITVRVRLMRIRQNVRNRRVESSSSMVAA